MAQYRKILAIKAEALADKEEYELYKGASQEEFDALVQEGIEEFADTIGCEPEEVRQFDFIVEEEAE